MITIEEDNKKWEKIQKKKDKTRLKNLLRNYENAIITNYIESHKWIKIDRCCDIVRNAIEMIKNNL